MEVLTIEELNKMFDAVYNQEPHLPPYIRHDKEGNRMMVFPTIRNGRYTEKSLMMNSKVSMND